MASPISSIIREATRNPNEPLNVISYPTHERFQTCLSKVNAHFYLWQGEGIKDWKHKYAPLPINHSLLNPSRGQNQIPDWLDVDLVLSQNKFAHMNTARAIAQHHHVPLISLEHCLPSPGMTAIQIEQIKQLRGDINVFISDYNRKQWGWSEDDAEVIHHGVDTEIFSPDISVEKKNYCLYVCNDLRNRDVFCGYNLWEESTKNLPRRLVGDNPGISESALSVADLVREYREASVFCCTSKISPIPTVVLESMACETPVVAFSNCMLPEIIKHGENGFLVNSAKEMRHYLQLVMNDRELAKKLGSAARQTILTKFSLDAFVNNWNALLRKAVSL